MVPAVEPKEVAATTVATAETSRPGVDVSSTSTPATSRSDDGVASVETVSSGVGSPSKVTSFRDKLRSRVAAAAGFSRSKDTKDKSDGLDGASTPDRAAAAGPAAVGPSQSRYAGASDVLPSSPAQGSATTNDTSDPDATAIASSHDEGGAASTVQPAPASSGASLHPADPATFTSPTAIPDAEPKHLDLQQSLPAPAADVPSEADAGKSVAEAPPRKLSFTASTAAAAAVAVTSSPAPDPFATGIVISSTPSSPMAASQPPATSDSHEVQPPPAIVAGAHTNVLSEPSSPQLPSDLAINFAASSGSNRPQLQGFVAFLRAHHDEVRGIFEGLLDARALEFLITGHTPKLSDSGGRIKAARAGSTPPGTALRGPSGSSRRVLDMRDQERDHLHSHDGGGGSMSSYASSTASSIRPTDVPVPDFTLALTRLGLKHGWGASNSGSSNNTLSSSQSPSGRQQLHQDQNRSLPWQSPVQLPLGRLFPIGSLQRMDEDSGQPLISWLEYEQTLRSLEQAAASTAGSGLDSSSSSSGHVSKAPSPVQVTASGVPSPSLANGSFGRSLSPAQGDDGRNLNDRASPAELITDAISQRRRSTDGGDDDDLDRLIADLAASDAASNTSRTKNEHRSNRDDDRRRISPYSSGGDRGSSEVAERGSDAQYDQGIGRDRTESAYDHRDSHDESDGPVAARSDDLEYRDGFGGNQYGRHSMDTRDNGTVDSVARWTKTPSRGNAGGLGHPDQGRHSREDDGNRDGGYGSPSAQLWQDQEHARDGYGSNDTQQHIDGGGGRRGSNDDGDGSSNGNASYVYPAVSPVGRAQILQIANGGRQAHSRSGTGTGTSRQQQRHSAYDHGHHGDDVGGGDDNVGNAEADAYNAAIDDFQHQYQSSNRLNQQHEHNSDARDHVRGAPRRNTWDENNALDHHQHFHSSELPGPAYASESGLDAARVVEQAGGLHANHGHHSHRRSSVGSDRSGNNSFATGSSHGQQLPSDEEIIGQVLSEAVKERREATMLQQQQQQRRRSTQVDDPGRLTQFGRRSSVSLTQSPDRNGVTGTFSNSGYDPQTEADAIALSLPAHKPLDAVLRRYAKSLRLLFQYFAFAQRKVITGATFDEYQKNGPAVNRAEFVKCCKALGLIDNSSTSPNLQQQHHPVAAPGMPGGTMTSPTNLMTKADVDVLYSEMVRRHHAPTLDEPRFIEALSRLAIQTLSRQPLDALYPSDGDKVDAVYKRLGLGLHADVSRRLRSSEFQFPHQQSGPAYAHQNDAISPPTPDRDDGTQSVATRRVDRRSMSVSMQNVGSTSSTAGANRGKRDISPGTLAAEAMLAASHNEHRRHRHHSQSTSPQPQHLSHAGGHDARSPLRQAGSSLLGSPGFGGSTAAMHSRRNERAENHQVHALDGIDWQATRSPGTHHQQQKYKQNALQNITHASSAQLSSSYPGTGHSNIRQAHEQRVSPLYELMSLTEKRGQQSHDNINAAPHLSRSLGPGGASMITSPSAGFQASSMLTPAQQQRMQPYASTSAHSSPQPRVYQQTGGQQQYQPSASAAGAPPSHFGQMHSPDPQHIHNSSSSQLLSNLYGGSSNSASGGAKGGAHAAGPTLSLPRLQVQQYVGPTALSGDISSIYTPLPPSRIPVLSSRLGPSKPSHGGGYSSNSTNDYVQHQQQQRESGGNYAVTAQGHQGPGPDYHRQQQQQEQYQTPSYGSNYRNTNAGGSVPVSFSSPGGFAKNSGNASIVGNAGPAVVRDQPQHFSASGPVYPSPQRTQQVMPAQTLSPPFTRDRITTLPPQSQQLSSPGLIRRSSISKPSAMQGSDGMRMRTTAASNRTGTNLQQRSTASGAAFHSHEAEEQALMAELAQLDTSLRAPMAAVRAMPLDRGPAAAPIESGAFSSPSRTMQRRASISRTPAGVGSPAQVHPQQPQRASHGSLSNAYIGLSEPSYQSLQPLASATVGAAGGYAGGGYATGMGSPSVQRDQQQQFQRSPPPQAMTSTLTMQVQPRSHPVLPSSSSPSPSMPANATMHVTPARHGRGGLGGGGMQAGNRMRR